MNKINMFGCAIVFMGVLLYKVVFHLEKAERKAATLIDGEDPDDGKLIRKAPSYEDDINYEFVSPRAVELVDRHPGQYAEEHQADDEDGDEGETDDLNDSEHKLV